MIYCTVRLLTSAATVRGFKARTWVGRVLSHSFLVGKQDRAAKPQPKERGQLCPRESIPRRATCGKGGSRFWRILAAYADSDEHQGCALARQVAITFAASATPAPSPHHPPC